MSKNENEISNRIESITNKNYNTKTGQSLSSSSLPLKIINNSKISFRNQAASIDLNEDSHGEENTSRPSQVVINKEAPNGAFSKKSMQRNQSRKLPYPIIYLIMLITGITNSSSSAIDEQGNSKSKKIISNLKKFTKFNAIISTILYVLTICTGLVFAITNIWYLVGDSINTATKTTLFTRSVSILLALIWFSLGGYAINVLHNLYITKDLQDLIRLKTKSYFKIPASFILILLIAVFLYSIFANMHLTETECQKIELHVMICSLKFYFTIIYSVITLFWNYLVAMTIMIINRTTTINIRRFLIELENDSFKIMKISADLAEKMREITNGSQAAPSADVSMDLQDIDIDYDDDEENVVKNANMKRRVPTQNIDCSVCLNRFVNVNLHMNANYLSCDHVKSVNSILQDYWRIASTLKLVSTLTQRWMFSLITSILMWCLSCLIDWIDNKNPSLTSVLEFILPLILLAVIFGTFAEANAEGNKIAQVIHPLEERIWTLNYLRENPLQIRMYGFPLDYGLEVKFIGAVAIGFLSQIIFHEMNN